MDFKNEFERLTKTSSFPDKLKECKTKSDVLKLIKEYGIDASEEDLKDFINNKVIDNIELDDDALESVVGGIMNTTNLLPNIGFSGTLIPELKKFGF